VKNEPHHIGAEDAPELIVAIRLYSNHPLFPERESTSGPEIFHFTAALCGLADGVCGDDIGVAMVI
jgi:hypothetical protein